MENGGIDGVFEIPFGADLGALQGLVDGCPGAVEVDAQMQGGIALVVLDDLRFVDGSDCRGLPWTPTPPRQRRSIRRVGRSLRLALRAARSPSCRQRRWRAREPRVLRWSRAGCRARRENASGLGRPAPPRLRPWHALRARREIALRITSPYSWSATTIQALSTTPAMASSWPRPTPLSARNCLVSGQTCAGGSPSTIHRRSARRWIRTVSKSRPTSTSGRGAARGKTFVMGCSTTSGMGNAFLMVKSAMPSGTTNGAPALAAR